MSVTIIPVRGIPEVMAGDEIGRLLLQALQSEGLALAEGDVVVVTQKIVSKAEARMVDPRTVEPSSLAENFARISGRDPHDVEVALRESRRVVRMVPAAMILETRHGFVCANAGVDHSNVDDGMALLLPEDPDGSAARIRESIMAHVDVRVAVIISDTFGRPWRMGQTNVAIGIAGMSAFNDYRGQTDSHGREMQVTQIAVADELASAAELVQNKVDRVPISIIRGYPFVVADGKGTDLVRPPEKDLFR